MFKIIKKSVPTTHSPITLVSVLLFSVSVANSAARAEPYIGSVDIPGGGGTEVVNLHLRHNGVEQTIRRGFSIEVATDIDTSSDSIIFNEYSLPSGGFVKSVSRTK